MMKRLKGLCALLLAMLCLLGCASAEETTTFTFELELLSEGGMPEVGVRPRTYATQDLMDYLYEQLLGSVKSINLKDYDLTVLDALTLKYAMEDVTNLHPELFHVGSQDHAFDADSSGKILCIRPTYKYVGEELQQKRAIYNAGVQEIVDYAKKAKTVIGQIMRVNDYICAHYAYDDNDDGIVCNSPELMFEHGDGLCQAYMLAAGAAFDKLGIPNVPATSRPMNHTWNLVLVDDDWYHVDTTWNDPLDNSPLCARHTYFMMSDEAAEEKGHYLWKTTETALNDQYDDMFWEKMDQAAPMVDDVVYYLDGSENVRHPWVRSYDLKSGETKSYFSFDAPGYAQHGIHPIWATRSRAFYAVEHEVFAMPIAGDGEPVSICKLTEDEHIWAMFLEGDVLHLFAAAEPGREGAIYKVVLSEAHEISLQSNPMHLLAGQTAQLQAVIEPPVEDAQSHLHWYSSDPSVASVDAQGNVTALKVGAAQITVDYDEILYAYATVIVHGEQVLNLPADLEQILPNAFNGVSAQEAVLHEGITHIGANAFANCPDLKLVNLPASIKTIAGNAFANSSNVLLLCASETGKFYAEGHGLPYLMIEP